MLARNTAFLASIYTHDGDPWAYAWYYIAGGIDASGYMVGLIYTTATTIQDSNDYTSSNVTWQKSADSGNTYTDVTHGGRNTLLFGTSSLKPGSSTVYKAETQLTIADLELADYALYRIKATGTDGTIYSRDFDFSKPT